MMKPQTLFLFITFCISGCHEYTCDDAKEPTITYTFHSVVKHDDHFHFYNSGEYSCYELHHNVNEVDRIYFQDNGKTIIRNVEVCDFYNPIKIPLDLNGEQLKVIFKRNTQQDTLVLNYKLGFEENNSCGLTTRVESMKTTSTLLTKEDMKNLNYRDENENMEDLSAYNFNADYYFVLEY